MRVRQPSVSLLAAIGVVAGVLALALATVALADGTPAARQTPPPPPPPPAYVEAPRPYAQDYPPHDPRHVPPHARAGAPGSHHSYRDGDFPPHDPRHVPPHLRDGANQTTTSRRGREVWSTPRGAAPLPVHSYRDGDFPPHDPRHVPPHLRAGHVPAHAHGDFPTHLRADAPPPPPKAHHKKGRKHHARYAEAPRHTYRDGDFPPHDPRHIPPHLRPGHVPPHR